MHVILSDERDGILLEWAFGSKTSSYVNNISQGGVKLLGAGTGSLHSKEAQCSLFIFVGWQSAWLSNNGKSPRPWEIIIKQRTTHSAQYAECVNTGGEQVCSASLTFEWCQHSRGNKAFHRESWWRSMLWLGFVVTLQVIQRWQVSYSALAHLLIHFSCLS